MEIILRHFETIGSTNTWAKENAHLLQKDVMTLVTADEQTAGRGRFKRQWQSPPKQNIYATYCFFLEKHRTDIGNIPQIMAIAAADALLEMQFSPKLKWPNDVLLNGKKVGGILCETTPLSDQLCLILGIGLNVNMPKEACESIDRPATSLLVESGKEHNIDQVLQLLTNHFVKKLDHFLDEGFLPFYSKYKDLMQIDANMIIKFDDNRVVWEGTIAGVQPDGTLLMKLKDGSVRKFVSGEILF